MSWSVFQLGFVFSKSTTLQSKLPQTLHNCQIIPTLISTPNKFHHNLPPAPNQATQPRSLGRTTSHQTPATMCFGFGSRSRHHGAAMGHGPRPIIVQGHGPSPRHGFGPRFGGGGMFGGGRGRQCGGGPQMAFAGPPMGRGPRRRMW